MKCEFFFKDGNFYCRQHGDFNDGKMHYVTVQVGEFFLLRFYDSGAGIANILNFKGEIFERIYNYAQEDVVVLIAHQISNANRKDVPDHAVYTYLRDLDNLKESLRKFKESHKKLPEQIKGSATNADSVDAVSVVVRVTNYFIGDILVGVEVE